MADEQPTSGPAAPPAQLQARLFALPAAAPELSPAALEDPDAHFGPPWAGVCISGGGSRSLSAAMGELRGLAALGVLPQIGWLSTVSGGTWAGTLFNWAPTQYSDALLLGPLELDPARLRWDSGGPVDDLSRLDPHALGSAATRLGLEEMLAKAIELYHRGVSVSELWPRAIGELVLAPFGLGDSPQRYFSWTPGWLERQILADNRGLRASDFFLTRANRPYLVTHSTLFYPPNPPASLALPVRPAGGGGPANPWEVGYDFETTPISAGIPPAFANAGPPSPGQPSSSDLGGGWIDPFALGSIAPSTVAADGRFRVPTPPNRFRLSDLAGLSSVAFVYDVLDLAHQRGIHFLDDMVPETVYWPVFRAGQLPRNAARPYLFGDGGNLENQGIMALLRRNLPKVIAFVNTETQLSMSGNEVIVDSDLPPLFGLEWSGAQGKYVAISADLPLPLQPGLRPRHLRRPPPPTLEPRPGRRDGDGDSTRNRRIAEPPLRRRRRHHRHPLDLPPPGRSLVPQPPRHRSLRHGPRTPRLLDVPQLLHGGSAASQCKAGEPAGAFDELECGVGRRGEWVSEQCGGGEGVLAR